MSFFSRDTDVEVLGNIDSELGQMRLRGGVQQDIDSCGQQTVVDAGTMVRRQYPNDIRSTGQLIERFLGRFREIIDLITNDVEPTGITRWDEGREFFQALKNGTTTRTRAAINV